MNPWNLDLLDFHLPDFTRVSWVSDAARETWEPRVRRILNVWAEIEWRAVEAGVRRAGIATVMPDRLPDWSRTLVRAGLSLLPSTAQGMSSGYSNVERKPTWGSPFCYRVLIARHGDLVDFQDAWDTADQHRIGEMLGYPSCCRDFFQELWVEHGMRDTTWAMAHRSLESGAACEIQVPKASRALEVSGPATSNILGRWLGVRAVSHLPCRFDCPATVEVADQLLAIGRDAGHGEEMDWLVEILDWPAEWSALHGIAEIKLPVAKFSAATDATAAKYVVRRPGASWPENGAEGLDFPFRRSRPPRLRNSVGYRRGLENPLPILQDGCPPTNRD